MDLNAQKEEFSYGYLQLLCAYSGLAFQKSDRQIDNIGIDIIITATQKNFLYLTQLAGQVKCTSQNVEKDDHVVFSLDVKTYNDLRNKSYTQRILFVVIVPEKLEDWLTTKDNEIIFRKCGYWIDLQGFPATDNTNSITITIPKQNKINSQTLLNLIEEESNKKNQLIEMIENMNND